MSIRGLAYNAAFYSMIAMFPIPGAFYASVTPSIAAETSTIIASWPPLTGIDNSAFTGDPTLPAPASIRLTRSDNESALRFSFASSSASSAYIGYKINGKITEGWHNFNIGERVTVRIPGNIDDQTVWISRDPKQTPFNVKKIEIVRGM